MQLRQQEMSDEVEKLRAENDALKSRIKELEGLLDMTSQTAALCNG